ncbi:MAG: hypothetical protein ACODAC_04340 [Pseudomonadota bacterium]
MVRHGIQLALLAGPIMLTAACAHLPLGLSCGGTREDACRVSIIELIVAPRKYEGQYVRLVAPLWLEAGNPKGFAAVSEQALTLLDAPNMIAVDVDGDPCDIDTAPTVVEGRFATADDYDYRGVVRQARVVDPETQTDACARDDATSS